MRNLDHLALFLRTVELGSISAAARSLDISAAVASQRVQRLERQLGVRLLHRTTRRLSATAEGAMLALRGRGLLDELDSLTQSLTRSSSEASGELRMTASASFGRYHVSPLLPDFLRRYPKLSINAHFSDQRMDLIEAGFDLAIRIGELPDSSLVARRLAPNRSVVCAAPSYLKKHGTPRDPKELAEHNCLLMNADGMRQDTWRFRAGRGELAVRVRGTLESNLGATLRDAALAGVGIAINSTWHIGDDLRAGRLIPLLLDFPLPEAAIHALMPHRRQVPLKVRVFVDYLAAQFGSQPRWDRGLDDLLRPPLAKAPGPKRKRS